MTPNAKPKIAMYWASSCGGCDISLLEVRPLVLQLTGVAEVAFWPCVADFKYTTLAAYPDASLDLCFFSGGIRNSEQEEIARLLRKKSRTLIAYGACAGDGGIPALANLYTSEAVFDAAYHSGPTIDNPSRIEPQPEVSTWTETLNIPRFYPAVLRLRDVAPVDYEIPGCPPQADQVWEAIEAIGSGAVPPCDGRVKVGCSNKTVCDECTREKRLTKISGFRRLHQFRPEPGWCLLEQGLLCAGPATRGGCGALCPAVNMPCEGCYGSPANTTDQGTSMTGALGTLIDATSEDRARELVSQIVDPTGTFYRFSMASSTLKFAR